MQVNRKELYARIWVTPIQRIAKELGTSCTAIHEACRIHQIPKPGRGHWRRVETGGSTPVEPLPEPTKDYPIQLPGSAEPSTVATPPRALRRSDIVAGQGAMDEATVRTHVDRDSGPDPIALMRRLPDSADRELFIRALEDEVATRSPETAAAVLAWINRAKGAAVVLELIETVAEWGESRTSKAPTAR